MITPLIVWACIVGLFVVIMLTRIFNVCARCTHGAHRFIELGSEREEFYVPGDPFPDKVDNCDDDTDDL